MFKSPAGVFKNPYITDTPHRQDLKSRKKDTAFKGD